MDFFDDIMDDFSSNAPSDGMGLEHNDPFPLDGTDGITDFYDPSSDLFPNNITIDMNDHPGRTNHDQIMFTGIYTESEIKHFQDVVDKCQYEVNHLKDEVHHHENMVNLVDTKHGHESGEYADELDDLNDIKSDYKDAVSRLNDAIEKLNNAR